MSDTVPIDADLNLFAKERSLVGEWNSRRLYPKLKKIVIVLAQAIHAFGKPCVITSIYRADGGIHNDWRAVDVRSQNLTPDEIALIRGSINKRFPYGLKSDGTPGETVPPVDHKAAQSVQAVTGPHFHVQLSSNNL